MTVEHGRDGALDEGHLVAWLDGELPQAEAAAVADHVAGCEPCAARASSLDTRSRRFGRALAEADPRAPGAGEWREVLETVKRGGRRTLPHAPLIRRAPRLLPAAGWILALLAVGALATSPVRAWIGERLVGLTGGDDPVPAELPVAEDAGGTELRFEPRGAELEVVVQTAQLGGTLSLRFGDAAAATVTVRGAGTEHLTVGGRTLRIANTPEAGSSYTLDLPGGVRRVRVLLGARAPVVLERTEAEGSVVVDLTTGRVRNSAARDEG